MLTSELCVVDKVVPTTEHPRGLPVEIMEGEMPITNFGIYEFPSHPGNYDAFPSCCQLCSSGPDKVQGERFVRMEVDRLGSGSAYVVSWTEPKQAKEEILICGACLAALAALWERSGRPGEWRYDEVLNSKPTTLE